MVSRGLIVSFENLGKKNFSLFSDYLEIKKIYGMEVAHDLENNALTPGMSFPYYSVRQSCLTL